MHVTAFYQQIVIGVVIILAVLIDRLRRGASS
jgi:predicted ABC-type sugar transport system permease subunit